tara:strand:+ start:241 stop:489 length:249 start_codon:yes stop_codon:yes gene_type:complete
MKGYIFGDASDPSTWRIYVPAHCLILSFQNGHLNVELDNTERSTEKIRDVEVPTSIIQKARHVLDVQKRLDSHVGWARATLK